MDWVSVRYWWDGLETRDRLLLAAILAAGLVLLTPWRRSVVGEAKVKPVEGEAYLLKSPGSGTVREVRAVQGQVLLPGEVAFTYWPQMAPVRYPADPYYPSGNLPNPYQDDEQRIRERYNRQISEAMAYITSAQQQLNRAYMEQGRSARGGISYEVQLAQNAVARAQQAPGELRAKMEEELAAARQRRDSYSRFNQTVQAELYPRPVANSRGEMTVTVGERVWVQSSTLRPGLGVQPDQDCALLVPERAVLEILAAVPAAFAREVHPGMAATLEVDRWMRDAETYPLTLARLGNRELDPEEALVFHPGVPATPYVLATFQLDQANEHLFPPPPNCKIRMAGARHCCLVRLFR